MILNTSAPVVVVGRGSYPDSRDRSQPMRRTSGSTVDYVEVIANGAPLGTPVTSIPVAEGVDVLRVQPGSLADLGIELRTEHVGRIGKSGSAYTAAAVKQRVVSIEVRKAAASGAQAAA